MKCFQLVSDLSVVRDLATVSYCLLVLVQSGVEGLTETWKCRTDNFSVRVYPVSGTLEKIPFVRPNLNMLYNCSTMILDCKVIGINCYVMQNMPNIFRFHIKVKSIFLPCLNKRVWLFIQCPTLIIGSSLVNIWHANLTEMVCVIRLSPYHKHVIWPLTNFPCIIYCISA